MANHFENFKKYAFRLELLQEYNVDGEKESIKEFLKTGKVSEDKDWTNLIKSAISRGAFMERVHVIILPISKYLKYEIEAYKANIEAGEKVSFMLKEEFDKINTKINHDFWLFDDKIVLKMNYDLSGKFKGFEEIKNASEFVKLKDITLLKSKPISELK